MFTYTFGGANPTPAELARGLEEIARQQGAHEHRERHRHEQTLAVVGSVGMILGALIMTMGPKGDTWWALTIAALLMVAGLYGLWAASRIEIDPINAQTRYRPLAPAPEIAQDDAAAETRPMTRPEPLRPAQVPLRPRGDHADG